MLKSVASAQTSRERMNQAIKILINQTIPKPIVNHLPMYGTLFLSRAYFWYFKVKRMIK